MSPDFKPRRTSDDFKKELQRQDRADVVSAEKAMSPDRVSEPRCHVCQHAYRGWIEMMLVRGIAYKTIADRANPKVDRRSLSNHHKKHMNLDDAALRWIIEEEAKLEGRNFEDGVGDAITKRAVLEVALRKGYHDIVSGVTTAEVRDVIQIAKVLGEMDLHQHQIGLDEMRVQVQIFIQAIQDVCDADTQGAIRERVKFLRKGEGVDVQIESVMDPPAIAEASVVEEYEEV